MKTAIPGNSSIADCGANIYEKKLRERLEPAHNGKYVIIDVETGEYELDTDHLAASNRAAAKWPGSKLYATRVGSGILGKLGGRTAVSRS